VLSASSNVLRGTGGGLWMPEAQSVAALRRDIDRKPHKMKNVLRETRLRKEILGVTSDDEKKVIQAFVKGNASSALKTKPKVSNLLPCPFTFDLRFPFYSAWRIAKDLMDLSTIAVSTALANSARISRPEPTTTTLYGQVQLRLETRLRS
jgi:hypothetical protein